jgi:hypothetical protein
MMDNDKKKINAMIASGELSGEGDVWVHHDLWCGSHGNRRCNCDPAIHTTPPWERGIGLPPAPNSSFWTNL